MHNSLPVLLFSVGLVSLPTVAQSTPCPAEREQREVILTGVPEEPPAVVYATANLPLVLVFDEPFRKESPIVLQGADVRAHPFLANALVLTPSNALADQGSAPLSVPLANGGVALKLAFEPGRRDGLVLVVRRAPAARSGPVPDELQRALHLAAKAAFEGDNGADAVGPIRNKNGAAGVRQRAVEGFSYLEVTTQKPECVPTAARLLHGHEQVDVLLAEQMTPCTTGMFCTLILVVRTPAEGTAGYELELLAQDGALCKRLSDITLGSNAR